MSTHAGYILAAYGFTAVVVLALIAWALIDQRMQAKALAKLEARLGRGE